MKTLTMMNEAERTYKTYINKDLRYSVRHGFHKYDGEPWGAGAFNTINDIMQLEGWKILEQKITKKMTLKEIEIELGYKIELVSESVNNTEVF